jgi:hypothetical protein
MALKLVICIWLFFILTIGIIRRIRLNHLSQEVLDMLACRKRALDSNSKQSICSLFLHVSGGLILVEKNTTLCMYFK